MPDKKLVVIGAGPDFEKIKKLAAPNVQMLGYQPDEVLKDYMQRAEAFVFAAEEDFGITPVEAQACGTPVIAFGKGGSLETVRGYGVKENPTGVFFGEQTVSALTEAVKRFEGIQECISPQNCRRHAEMFSVAAFRENIEQYIKQVLEKRKREDEGYKE